ncbi:endonuclease [bacterium]|nr:endonuclease [bacterium]
MTRKTGPFKPDLARERWIPPDNHGRPQDPASWAHPGDGFWGRFFTTMWDAWGDPYWWPGRNAWECAVGAVLVQNTTWKNAGRMIPLLRDAGWDNAPALLEAPVPELEQTLRPVGYYRMKTRKLRELATWWVARDVDNGGVDKLPDELLRDELLSIWGIGPETADDILVYSFGRPWFVVDAYAIRVRQRLLGNDAKPTYDELQAEVHAELPRDYMLMHQLHGMVVNLCKLVCRAKPKCEQCPLLDRCAFGQSRS